MQKLNLFIFSVSTLNINSSIRLRRKRYATSEEGKICRISIVMNVLTLG